MIVFSNRITNRLRFISDFIGKEITGINFHITGSIEEFKNNPGPRINYSDERVSEAEFWLKPHPLLFETGTKHQNIACVERKGYKTFFETEGDSGFDIFAASFYLLSRYEEYLPYQKDMYGRYAHENSLAFKEGFLTQPLVNMWLQDFREALKQKFPAPPLRHSSFTLLPTYDIDEAYCYRHKDRKRSAGAAIKDLLNGRGGKFRLRRDVLNGKKEDPFDSYDWINDLHRSYKLKPRYFFLVPDKTGRYDRNVLPSVTAMQVLIRQHADKYEIGVHPSWQSGDTPSLIRKEIQTIEDITGTKPLSSRQHFIRFTLPHTYRQLIEAGIKEDFSMGYGSINGFRASVASPFYWYDLEKEETTCLLVYPFCYMEANSFYEQKFSPQEALEEMRQYYNEVKKVNGTLITIWHNTFLGTDSRFEGWREIYAEFIKEIC